jgi:hypothetical protein
MLGQQFAAFECGAFLIRSENFSPSDSNKSTSHPPKALPDDNRQPDLMRLRKFAQSVQIIRGNIYACRNLRDPPFPGAQYISRKADSA